MPKIELWRLGQGEVFKFHQYSDLFALVEFDEKYLDEPFDCQIAIIKNLNTGKLSSTQVYFPVFIEPFEFTKQLTLF